MISSNLHDSSRHHSNDNNNKLLLSQRSSSEVISSTEKTEHKKVDTFLSTNDYEFAVKTTQSLTLDNKVKKKSSIKSSIPSAIPQEPVSMHRTINLPAKPIDIQFGDIQWSDSIPMALTSSNIPILVESGSEQQSSSNAIAVDYEQQVK